MGGLAAGLERWGRRDDDGLCVVLFSPTLVNVFSGRDLLSPSSKTGFLFPVPLSFIFFFNSVSLRFDLLNHFCTSLYRLPYGLSLFLSLTPSTFPPSASSFPRNHKRRLPPTPMFLLQRHHQKKK